MLLVTPCRAKGDVLIEVASFDGEETVSGKGKVAARTAERAGRQKLRVRRTNAAY